MSRWCGFCGTNHGNELIYKECARMQADGETAEPA